MEVKKLKVMDADSVLSTAFPKTFYAVDGLIPQGLSVLSGSNKIGKSWLMLWLALQVAKGEPVWGMSSNKCDVLYLCLEDTFSRIQKRLYELTDEAPNNLKLAVTSLRIGYGLEQQIEDFVKEFPETKLIIVDTFQKVRDSKSAVGKAGMYANDYDDITALKDMADEFNIAIIIVHHVRKFEDKADPFNNVSGSTGITGAADTNFILKRTRASDMGTFLVNGRDVEYQEFTLNFDKKSHIWQLIERKNKDDILRENTPDFLFRIVELVKNNGEFKGTSTELLMAVNETETAVNAVTKILARYAFDILFPENITFKTKKTGTNRLIILTDEAAVQS